MKFLNDLRFQKNLLLQNKSCLNKGTYILHNNLRTYLQLGHSASKWFPSAKITLKNIVKILIARIFYSIRINKNGKQFSAQAVYFSNELQTCNRDIKFFDYEKQIIKTICPNRSRYDSYMRNRSYFGDYFPLVDLLATDEEELAFVEKMITKSSISDEEWESVFQKLFSIYSAYYNKKEIDAKHNVTYLCTNFSRGKIEKNYFVTSFYRQHGDLSSDNFIYDTNGNVYIIDYEHADYYPYFYDLFFLMVNLYVWKDNHIGINLMVKGSFDNYFKNTADDSTTSIYDAFLLFADYFLSVYSKKGLPYEWCVKYDEFFGHVLDMLKR